MRQWAGLAKAEDWLMAIAQDPQGSWRNWEAIIYFLSRRKHVRQLKEAIQATKGLWGKMRRTLYHTFLFTGPEDEESEAVRMHAASNIITAEELLRGSFNSSAFWFSSLAPGELRGHQEFVRSSVYPRFWFQEHCYSLDGTMLRIAHWLGSTAADSERWRFLSTSIEAFAKKDVATRDYMALYLFALDRADDPAQHVAAARQGLVQAICRNPFVPDQPWKTVQMSADVPRTISAKDSIGIASSLLLHKYHYNYDDVPEAMARGAEILLLTEQQDSGAWQRSDDSHGRIASVLCTAMAVHALWGANPADWQDAAQRGARWLQKNQRPSGEWAESGADPVFLTVLVLDAIELANGSGIVTFKVRRESESVDGRQAKPGGVKKVTEAMWLTVTEAAKKYLRDVDGLNLNKAKGRVSIAATRGEFETNGKKGQARRIEPNSFAAWQLDERNRNLDAEDEDEDDDA